MQLEGLVKAGAFDKIESDRKALLDSIPKLIQLNKSISEEKISNQSSLFSDNTDENDLNIKLNHTKPWSKNEILLNEFQSIGFYMSDHPLKIYEDFFAQLKISSFLDFKKVR